MIESLAHLSWLLSNIAVPILAPIALLPLLNFSLAYREIAGDVLKAALQHGQLFWTVIAMSAAACYELGCALDQPMFASSRSWIWIGLVWHRRRAEIFQRSGQQRRSQQNAYVGVVPRDSIRRDELLDIPFCVELNI
jgi:hypothetical protein